MKNQSLFTSKLIALCLTMTALVPALATDKSGSITEGAMLQTLLAQKIFSPDGLSKIESADGIPVFFIPIKASEAENLLQQLRTKTAAANYCPVIIENEDRLRKLASCALWCPSLLKMTVDDIAKQLVQTESISLSEAEKQAQHRKQLWAVQDGQLQLNATTSQIVAAAKECDLELWFQLKQKVESPPKTNISTGRPKIGRKLAILGLQPGNFNREEFEAGLRGSTMSIGGGTSVDSKTGEFTDFLEVRTSKNRSSHSDDGQEFDDFIKEVTEQAAARELLLCFVPVQHSWQIPAFFRFGNYGDSPSTVVHTAFQKRLHDKFGSEVASIDTTQLEVTLKEVPQLSEVAELSKELAIYNKYFAGGDPKEFQQFLEKSTVWTLYW